MGRQRLVRAVVLLVPIALGLPLLGCSAGAAPAGGPGPAFQGRPALTPQSSGTESLLQAVSAVGAGVVWVGGHQGTILRTLDGGRSWARRTTPSLDSLQFRDIHAFGADAAVALTAGEGALSRLYRTGDGGETWSLSFLMNDERGFLDCMDFLDDSTGYAYGDSFDGLPYLLVTRDAGRTWTRVGAEALPQAGPGEGGFAASGTCARAAPGGAFHVATGAGGNARVLTLRPGATRWMATDVDVVRGDAAGLTTISFSDADLGLALGGDLANMQGRTANVVTSSDGGRTWRRAGPLTMAGPVYGSAFAVGSRTAVAVGPGGADYTHDAGASWSALSSESYWAVDVLPDGTGWMVGPEGRITRIALGR